MENINFKDLNISNEILKAIEKMGFEETTQIQTLSIPPMLKGNDIIAQAPTGTGKTCAFGIPVIENIDINESNVQAIVLCPTRELALQITEELKNISKYKKGINITPVYGGQQIDRQISALKRKPQIVIATPGRMLDHLRRKTLKINNVKLLVLDEADEMLNMGFREDIDTILKNTPNDRQTVLFSATLSNEIMEIANSYLKENADIIKINHKELTVPLIDQYYLEVKDKNKNDILLRLIDSNKFRLSLIFCNTKKMVDELTESMTAKGYSAEALHGDMKQVQRDRVMNRFRKGVIDILIATDVAARGIDVEEIDAVFNYDIPNDVEYYVHRIGRTGRAKRIGVSYTFVSSKEMYKLKEIMKYTKSVIKPFKAPNENEIMDIRTKKELEKVKTVLKNRNILKFVSAVENYVNDEEELTTLDVAAALLYLSLEDKSENIKPDIDKISFETGAESKMARIFINIGSLDKIKPRHLTEILEKYTSIKSNFIGSIDIFDKFSFVEVPYEYLNEVTKNIKGVKYKGKTVSAQLANKRKPKNH